MSDEVGTTIRYLFVGDSASLQEAFDQAAAAAQASLDKINAAADEASGSLDGTGASVEGLGAKFDQAGAQATGLGEKLDTIGEGAGASIEGLQAKFDGLDESITGVDDKLGTVADTSEEVSGKVDESSSVMSAALARVGAVLEGLEGKFGVVGEAAAKMGATISESADASDASLEGTSAKAGGLEASLAGIGKGTVIGLAVAAAGSLDLADKMDQATNSIAANANISTDAAAKIGAAFDSTAGSFIFNGTAMAKAYAPVAMQLASVQGHALSASQALLIEKDAADAAEATGTSLAGTTSALASVMQTYQIGVSGATSATNALYVAGKTTGSGFDGIAGQLSKLKATLGGLAPSLGDSSALLVDLTEHGETGRKAMAALSTAVTGLEKPTLTLVQAQQTQQSLLSQMPGPLHALAEGYASGHITSLQFTTATEGLSGAQAAIATKFAGTVTAVSDAKEAIKQSGISVENAKGQFLGLGPIIDELHRQIAGMSQQQAIATLTQDGLGSSALKLLPTIEAGSAAFDKARDAVTKNNAAQEAAQKATQNLHDQFEKAKAAIDDVVTEIGEKLMPVVERIVSGFAAATNFVMQHRVVLIALGVVIGGILVPALYAFVAAQVAAAAATIAANAPLLIIVATLAAVAAAAYEIYTHWKVIWPEVKKLTLDVWHDIEAVIHDAWEVILTIFKNATIVGLIYSHWTQIRTDAMAVWHAILSFLEQIPGEIIGIFAGGLTWLLHAGEDIIGGLGHGITGAWDFVYHWFVGLASQTLHALGNAGLWLIGAGYNVLMGLWHGIENGWSYVSGLISGIAHKVTSLFHDALSIFSPSKVFDEIGRNIMLGLGQGITGGAPDVYAKLGAVAKGLNPALSAGLGSFTVPAAAGALGAAAGGSRASSPLTINFSIDGQRFATAVVPDLVTAMQQRGRVINLGI